MDECQQAEEEGQFVYVERTSPDDEFFDAAPEADAQQEPVAQRAPSPSPSPQRDASPAQPPVTTPSPAQVSFTYMTVHVYEN